MTGPAAAPPPPAVPAPSPPAAPAPSPPAVPAPTHIGRRIAVASLYTILTRLILRGIGLVSTLILVRLLSPADFGIAGLASIAYGTFEMLMMTGFNLALIRMAAPARLHYDTVFTLNMLRGAVIAAALLLTARWQAHLMGDARIAPLMWLLAGTALLQSAESVRLVDLHRALRFERVMRYAVVGKVSGFLIVVPLAFIMHNYWPLLLSGFFSRLLVTIPYSYVLAPYRPRLALGAWRELFHFSKWLALGNVASILDMQLMNFVLGRYVGIGAVGLYQVVYQVAALPISEIAAPIRQPIYAGFSRIHHDAALLRAQFLKGLEMQCVVILPLSFGIVVTAPDIVALFLGAKWQAATALLPALALYALFDALGQYTHHLFIVLNRQRSYTFTFYASLAVRLPLTIWAASIAGARGAALAMLATAGFNMVLWAFQARPMLALRWTEVLARVWRAGTALLALAAGVLLAGRLLAGQPVALRFAAEVAGGGLAYAAALLLLWRLAGAPGDASEAQLLHLLGGAGARLLAHRRFA